MLRRRFLTHEHEDFRRSVSRYLQAEVAPHAQRWREQGIVDRSAWLKAGQQGLLMMWADEKYGGSGIDDLRFDQVMWEEWARFGEPGFAVSLHSRVVGPYLNELGTEEQRQRFLPKCVTGECILAIAMTEPGVGSDLSGMRMRAERRPGGWSLNGTKTYISNGILSDLVVVAAKCDSSDPRAVGLFLVERGMNGFERGRVLKKLGLKAQDTAELYFKDVFVPDSNVLGTPGNGLQSLFRFLPVERLTGAIRSLACASRALEITLEFVKERRVFDRPLGAFQNTRFMLADLRTQVDLCQALVDLCVADHLDGHLTPELAAEAKLAASEIEGRVVDECVQLHGGAGYMEEYEICRLYANARVSRIYAGSSEIMREIVGRSMGLDDRKLT
jgi:alkylation response protein AidB-like acyl-CoA dehydrogenase